MQHNYNILLYYSCFATDIFSRNFPAPTELLITWHLCDWLKTLIAQIWSSISLNVNKCFKPNPLGDSPTPKMNIFFVFNSRNKFLQVYNDMMTRKLQNVHFWVKLPFKHPPKIPFQLHKPPVTKFFLESDQNRLGTRQHSFV